MKGKNRFKLYWSEFLLHNPRGRINKLFYQYPGVITCSACDATTILTNTLLIMTLLITLLNVALHTSFYLLLYAKQFISKVSSR